ncbi:uncharacterized protein J7T54_008311 [Emericellopsis cladophorae]|uniref:Uncharacterized protein n=1 Tax=Emericellopsis cladophorae TaxID=2686198 RepID=A0A9Q0B8I6_9HYPO|nr:uncharacterized protein J7T54_008311 [Emericellopsis cladophorae]KAI6777977.1 hypothetical protein J7T54_008311 [Emericellopsis cladophorae]
MPPKRKALDTADANATVVPQPNAKKAKPAAQGAAAAASTGLGPIHKHEKRWSKVSASKNLDLDYQKSMQDPNHAYEFMCICDPTVDDDEYDEEEEGEGEGEEGEGKAGDKPSCDGGEKCPCNKTATSLPSHPYTVTRAGLRRADMARNMAHFRNPDMFAMYTFNDHHAYGVMEVVENMLLDFDEARKANEWREMWALVESMVLFVQFGGGSDMCMADDVERVEGLAMSIARLILTTLSTLESHDQLKEGSDIKNLGWMLALTHAMSGTLREMSVMGPTAPTKAKAFKFNPDNLDLYVCAFAHRHGITIPGVSEDDMAEAAGMAMPKAGAKDPWGWTRVGALVAGGDRFDITTMSSAERKKAAFDKKDPIPAKVMGSIKKGEPVCLG